MAAEAEKLSDLGSNEVDAEVTRWLQELDLAEENDEQWIKRADKVLDRYRDEREKGDENASQMNILWSNTETIKPALYARTPRPQVSSRFKLKDPIARAVSMALERSAQYFVDMCDFDDVMMAAVEDYQLPGRAVTRVYYKPKFVKERVEQQPIAWDITYEPNYDDPENPIEQRGEPQYAEGVEVDEQGGYTMEDKLLYEDVEAGTVFWKDFRMGKARNWRQTPWAAFRSFLTREQLHERFDESLGDDQVKLIPLNHTVKNSDDEDEDDGGESKLLKKAEIWEVWDKNAEQVIWVCPDYKTKVLDKKDPHLKFKNFYPCTKPLIMGKTTGTMTPVPEYCQYQDQAEEIDLLTQRINILVDAIRVAGVYDANAAGLNKLLDDTTGSCENKLYPIANWAKFMEGGGIVAAIAWLPIEQIISVLQQLYVARESVKQALYEITGIADIIRGASDPNETAAAQKIKGRFASMRLTSKQGLVAEHARQIIELMVEVIAENFAPETISKISGIPIDEQMSAMMKSDSMRCFAVSVETDSTIQPDEQEDKQSRVDFLNTMGNFMQGAEVIAKGMPELTPLLLEMLQFGMRGFRIGRELEETFDKVMSDIAAKQKQQAQQPPPPSPEMIKAQTDAKIKGESHQQNMQIKQEGHKMDQAFKVQDHQLNTQIAVAESDQDMKLQLRNAAIETARAGTQQKR